MRAWWVALWLAPVGLLWGAWLLLLPAPPAMGDLPGMMLVGGGVLLLLLGGIGANHARTDRLRGEERRRARRWHWWALGAYAGIGLAALVLGHRDLGASDYEALGPLGVAYHAVAHVVIAPLDLALGFVVGFLQRDALLVVLGSIAFALLAADLLRRRLVPRQREASQEGAAHVSGGSSAGP